MIQLEKQIFLTPLQKLPKNVRDFGKLIVARGFKKLSKVQKIALSGHTAGLPDNFPLNKNICGFCIEVF